MIFYEEKIHFIIEFVGFDGFVLGKLQVAYGAARLGPCILSSITLQTERLRDAFF